MGPYKLNIKVKIKKKILFLFNFFFIKMSLRIIFNYFNFDPLKKNDYYLLITPSIELQS